MLFMEINEVCLVCDGSTSSSLIAILQSHSVLLALKRRRFQLTLIGA